MNAHRIYTTATTVTTGEKTAVNIANLNKNVENRNNVGSVQVVGASTVTLEGSADGTNFTPIATGLTSTTGAVVALFPWMRVNVSTASGSSLNVYIIQ